MINTGLMVQTVLKRADFLRNNLKREYKVKSVKFTLIKTPIFFQYIEFCKIQCMVKFCYILYLKVIVFLVLTTKFWIFNSEPLVKYVFQNRKISLNSVRFVQIRLWAGTNSTKLYQFGTGLFWFRPVPWKKFCHILFYPFHNTILP